MSIQCEDFYWFFQRRKCRSINKKKWARSEVSFLSVGQLVENQASVFSALHFKS